MTLYNPYLIYTNHHTNADSKGPALQPTRQNVRRDRSKSRVRMAVTSVLVEHIEHGKTQKMHFVISCILTIISVVSIECCHSIIGNQDKSVGHLLRISASMKSNLYARDSIQNCCLRLTDTERNMFTGSYYMFRHLRKHCRNVSCKYCSLWQRWVYNI